MYAISEEMTKNDEIHKNARVCVGKKKKLNK